MSTSKRNFTIRITPHRNAVTSAAIVFCGLVFAAVMIEVGDLYYRSESLPHAMVVAGVVVVGLSWLWALVPWSTKVRYGFDAATRKLQITRERHGRVIGATQTLVFDRIRDVYVEDVTCGWFGLGQYGEVVLTLTNGAVMRLEPVRLDQAHAWCAMVTGMIDTLETKQASGTAGADAAMTAEFGPPASHLTAPSPADVISELRHCIAVLLNRELDQPDEAWLWRIKRNVAEQRYESLLALHGEVEPRVLIAAEMREIERSHPLLTGRGIIADGEPRHADAPWQAKLHRNVAKYLADRSE
ncbi:MAG: hypothetical protein GC159_12590 [Phycisphaera sp.]|nr:hypothetical protein [Phycisphaera sp.]